MSKYADIIAHLESNPLGDVCCGDTIQLDGDYMTDIIINTLRQAKEREENKPLTLEQLKERVGKPVWVEHTTKGETWLFLENISDRFIRFINIRGSDIALRLSEINNEFYIYDHEPKGE